jgi:tRNA(adenine34) deaminase
MYVTIEPCAMCAGALILARVKKIYFGAEDPKTGAFGSVMDINKKGLNHRIQVVKGLRRDECAGLLKEFFKKRRNDKG